MSDGGFEPALLEVRDKGVRIKRMSRARMLGDDRRRPSRGRDRRSYRGGLPSCSVGARWVRLVAHTPFGPLEPGFLIRPRLSGYEPRGRRQERERIRPVRHGRALDDGLSRHTGIRMITPPHPSGPVPVPVPIPGSGPGLFVLPRRS